MATCNDLNQQLKEIDDRLAAIESTKAGLKASADLAEPAKPTSKPKVLRTLDGRKVGVDSQEWIRQAELDAVRMGDEQVRQMVRASFEVGATPTGRTGRMINYAQLDAPTQENLAAVLELMGESRAASKRGKELMGSWTAELASKELQVMAAKMGGDPAQVAQSLANRMKGIKRLPSTMYMTAKAKWDSANQYADALEELADAIDEGTLTDQMKSQAAVAAQWAYTFEQMDAFIARKVGQAMRTRQFNSDFDVSLVEAAQDVKPLTLDQIRENSLVGGMLKLTNDGNAKELRKLSAAKRLNQTLGGGVNDSGFMADLRLLNIFRRANLLSSVATWAVRNPISGALVQGVYMAEDSLSGTIRLVNKVGLKDGVADGMQAAGYAYRNFNSAWSMAWGNAMDSFRTGRATMGDASLKFVDIQSQLDAKQTVDRTLKDKWAEIVSNPLNFANPMVTLNLMNAAVWKVFGRVGEELTKTDAGYMTPFRLLGTGDEFIRTQAYVWKANHEAFVRASEEGRAAGKSIEWIQDRADELSKDLIFDGIYTDDMLAAYRKKRNAEYGVPVADEMSDEELRAVLYDKYKNAPNLDSEIGQIADNRMSDVTFTQPMKNQILAGVNMMRQDPRMGWLLPFFNVPVNGLGWVLNREVLIQVPKQLLMEVGQATSGGTKHSVEEMADARARTVVAMAIAVATQGLWEAGVFTDGGGSDPRQQDREERVSNPYSFSLAGTMFAAGKFAGNGVDVVDLMGLHADVLRAWHEGVIGNNDFGMAVRKIVLAHGQLLKNRAALKNVSAVLNYAQDPGRYDLGRVLGDQMGGIMPVSGFFANFSRSLNDPEARMAVRRPMTPDEAAAIKRDPITATVGPVIELMRNAFVSANANYPLIGLAQPREKDWLGNKIQRPLGLPADLTIPFMPVIKPDDFLYKELAKHGFGDKPRPDAEVSMGGVKLQMTTDEEAYYREYMRTVKGEAPPRSPGQLLPIAQYVMGNDMQGALRALLRDPQYQQMLQHPVGRISPSLKVQPGKPLQQRLQAGGKDLYAPIDEIIDYYDDLAIKAVISNDKLDFNNRLQQVIMKKQGNLEEYFESLSSLGLGRL